MKQIKILFVCVHNSARSQMAETFLNHYGEGTFISESAGLNKSSLNPLVVKVMDEIGFDISENHVDDVFDFFKQHRLYSYVITVCDQINGQKCPIFPGAKDIINWSFEDPSSFEGPIEEQIEKTRKVRDSIQKKIIEFIDELKKVHH